jgi:hypothetical protein
MDRFGSELIINKGKILIFAECMVNFVKQNVIAPGQKTPCYDASNRASLLMQFRHLI